ncbi:MAG: cell division topological specificity factor MinE [Thermaerobacter sp.]|nr:cell division topological specificity factor MinE [Thermaerobacter sp.]
MWTRNGSSKQIAKDRLRNVLVHDRADTSPEFMSHLRDDLMRVVSEYLEVGQNGVDMKLQSLDDHVALVASIPVKQLKRARQRSGNN